MKAKTPKTLYRFEFTKDRRGTAERKAKEIELTPAQCEKMILKLEDGGAYNIEVRAESRRVFR